MQLLAPGNVDVIGKSERVGNSEGQGRQITIFWASKDLCAKFDLVEGWRSLVLGGMEVHEVPGNFSER